MHAEKSWMRFRRAPEKAYLEVGGIESPTKGDCGAAGMEAIASKGVLLCPRCSAMLLVQGISFPQREWVWRFTVPPHKQQVSEYACPSRPKKKIEQRQFNREVA